jgi:glutaredoxin
LGLAGCPDRGRVSRDARVPADLVSPLVVREGRGLLFSFFDRRAEMRTVEGPDKVAETARSDVMVTDPTRRLAGDLVYVADLRTRLVDGSYRWWVEAKGTWLDRVMPKTSLSKRLVARAKPAPKAKRKVRRRRPRRRPKRKPPDTPGAGTAAPVAGPQPQVFLFTTAWCPSCRSARQFFQQKGVPFRELDVEKDAQAQQQYLALQQQYRLRQGVVPLIIVNGRIFQGFSKPQIEAALAAGPPQGAGG